MERDYKKWLLREKAIKKKKVEEKNTKDQYLSETAHETQGSVSMIGAQMMNTSSDTEQQPRESKENYYRRRRITEIKKSGDTPPPEGQTGKQSSNYIKNYRTGSGNQIPANTRQREEDPKKRLADEIRRHAIEEAKAKIKQKAAQATRKVAQKAAQVTARAASQLSAMIARGLVQAGGWLLAAAVGAIGGTGCVVLIVILIIVMVIVVIYQTCNDNMISSAICEGVSWVGNAGSWLGIW